MAARWELLTEYLIRARDDVRITWPELDAIVGGMPASAVDHYPQWWHGDRPNTRAWRAAGYEATEIEPGVSVLFARSTSPVRPTAVTTSARTATTVASPDALKGLDPDRCLIVIPCSASKRKGGRAEEATNSSPDLSLTPSRPRAPRLAIR